jgi:hypothetical protein
MEHINASSIQRMSQRILKTVDDMERDLEEIEKNLAIYRRCLNDEISKEAEALVLSIHRRIDLIRENFSHSGQETLEAAHLTDVMQSGGLEG